MFTNRLLKSIILVLPLILTAIFSGCGGITTPGIPQDSLNAVITANPTSGEAPIEVTLDASESSVAQGNEIVSYEWDFGDGNTREGQIIQHGFDSPGNYTVELTISDNKGAVDTSSVIITVFQPTETVIEQNFNTQNGTEFDTGTGLKVSVPPSLNAEEVKLIVKYYSNPPQINDCIGNLFSAYSINMIYEKESQKQKLRPLRGSFEPIKLTFDIPEEEDIRYVLIVNKTDEGWVIAENKVGPYGGTISEDGKEISISLEYSSDYALSTPAVLTYNQQDMQELLSELEAQNAVIESAPPIIPNYKGIVIIPKEIFPEGKGNAIPIHIPSYGYSSNANIEEEGWENKEVIIRRVVKKNWWALLGISSEGVPLTPVGAAVNIFEVLASSKVNQIYDIAITIQKNKNTGGNLRAIIKLGDPEIVSWQRKLAGSKKAIGDPLWSRVLEVFGSALGALFSGASFGIDLDYFYVQNICDKMGLPFEPSYYLLIESDKRHKEDAYIGYLSVNENNTLVLIPRIYPDDRITIWRLEGILNLKRVLYVELPILNSYRFTRDYDTAILKELSPIQIGLESTQSNLVPIANAGPDQTVQVSTLVNLDGTASYDDNGDTLSYKWTQIKGPEIVNLSDSNFSKPTFTPTKVGIYEFELIVNDGGVNSESDNVIINVTESTTTPPDPPTPLSPGSSSAPGSTISTLTPTLQWQGVSGADYYRFSISIYPYGTSNIIYTSSNLSTTSFNLPSGELSNGNKYRWNMRAFTNAGVSSEYSSDLYFQTETPTTNKPDLIVNNIWTEPNPPIAAGFTTIGLEIKNQGNADAIGTFFLEFYFDGTYQGHVYINGLTAGSTNTSYWQAVTWPSDTNLHTIKGVVDPDNTIIESDESNNQYSIQVKATEPPIGTGTLKIESVPGSAKVYIDGAYKGETPSSGYLTISDLSAGDHDLKVTKSGYKDWIGVVTIPSGGTKYKAVILEPITLPLPIPLSPGTTSAPGSTISTLTPTLQWQGVAGADYYRFSISIYPYGTSNIIYTSSNLSTTSFNLPSGELSNGNKYRWNMRAFTNAGVSSEYSSDLYFQTPSLPSSQVERITNGSFSSGISGWTLVSDFWAGINFSSYRTPPGYAAGGVNNEGLPINNAAGWMYQTVTIPSGATSATLSFWYNITSYNPGPNKVDFLTVYVSDSEGNWLDWIIYSNLNRTDLGDYKKKTFDLTAHKGKTVTIKFLATSDYSNTTTFRIDDVSLMSDG